MFRFRLIVTLLFHAFSLRRDSLRFIHPRRVLTVLVGLSVYLVIFVLNWVFLLLDEVFFPGYRKTEVKKAAFIISIPRSATTYLFNSLLADTEHFHAFRLWELVLAPSICQKYLVRTIKRANRLAGSPLSGLVKLVDRALFGQIRPIHDIGIMQHEEDELLFLFNLSSLFLYYFFPGVPVLDKLLYHDTELPEKVKRRNMNFYYRMVQRHCQFYDPQGERYYLSKSPTFIPRMQSIARKFPRARVIYPLRTPFETIPSTISLNAHVMSQFCHLPEPYPLRDETREFLLRWYRHGSQVLREELADRSMVLPFPLIRDNAQEAFRQVYHFLGVPVKDKDWGAFAEKALRHRRVCRHSYDPNLGIDEQRILQALGDVLPADYLRRKA